VPPNHRRLEFEFTALSFVGTENISFRCRLDGYDDDWVEPKQGRVAWYPRLDKGDYKFRVKACNSEGIWNETSTPFAFIVTPFFWQTWWFQSAVVAAFTGLVIAVVRYVSFRRLRAQLLVLEQQAALYKERARIAKDIHDDLGASLTQISLLGELAHQDRAAPDKVGEHVNVIANTARRAVKSLDEIVWAVNPRNDTLAHFIDYTGQFALDYLRLAGVRCRLDLPEHVPARELSTDVRHNLFLVVKEAINNTVKYAHATELRLRIAVTDENLELSVEDNGCGFEQPSEADGADGLRNMRQRMADIGGRCWIQGRPGAGAKIALELPWARDEKRTDS
jgi:signal transduction histidine kinase